MDYEGQLIYDDEDNLFLPNGAINDRLRNALIHDHEFCSECRSDSLGYECKECGAPLCITCSSESFGYCRMCPSDDWLESQESDSVA